MPTARTATCTSPRSASTSHGPGLVASALFAITVHGRLNRDLPETTWLGGLDDELIALAAAELSSAGFKCAMDVTELSGKAPANICNASRSGRGLQLELPRDLRDALRDDGGQLQRFATAIRAAIRTKVEISPGAADMR